MAKYDIFISYRREGGYDTAKHLYDLLTRDGYKVSFDIDTLRNGDFDTSLLKRIDECKDFILIIDAHAFDRTLDPNFNPQNDWLRKELAYALRKNKNIIPIFLTGITNFPPNLPSDIAGVLKKNGPQYNRYYFNDFYELLKKDFITSKGMTLLRRLCIICCCVIACIGIIIIGYIYSPFETTERPLTEYDDDVLVPLPSIYSQNITDDVSDAFPFEALFFYTAPDDSNYSTGLIIEDYEGYSPEDIGAEDDDHFQSILELVRKMNNSEFKRYYIKSINLQDSELQINGSPQDVEYNGLEWTIFHFKKRDLSQYNAVYRAAPLIHVIFVMKMEPAPMSIEWRNSRIFHETLKKLSPKVNQYCINEL